MDTDYLKFLELKRLTDELLDRLYDYFEPSEIAAMFRDLADRVEADGLDS